MKDVFLNLAVIRRIVTVIMLMMVMSVSAQSNGDKLFMEGQALQQKQTIASQNQAIKKFEAAKIVYTTAEKKKMCDNQIAICNNNISILKKSKTNPDPSPKKKDFSLSQNRIIFDGDKKGLLSIAVNASTTDWDFRFSEGVAGEENFAKATRSRDAKSIDVEVEANPYTLVRHQSLIVSYANINDTVHVYQNGKSVTLSTNNNLVEFKLKGGSKSIELYTNSDSVISSNNGLTWYIVSKPDWIETTVEVKKEKGIFGKIGSTVVDAVSSKASAATAVDAKISNVKIIARPLAKSDSSYSTGRRGEIVFASQDKTYTIKVLQQ